MSKPQKSSKSSPKKGESSATPDILISASDERFFLSLYEFIEHEKEYQQCPEEGPDQLRYIIYRSVFNKVCSVKVFRSQSDHTPVQYSLKLLTLQRTLTRLRQRVLPQNVPPSFMFSS